MQFLHYMYSGINPDGVSFSQTHKLWLICQINGGEGGKKWKQTQHSSWARKIDETGKC